MTGARETLPSERVAAVERAEESARQRVAEGWKEASRITAEAEEEGARETERVVEEAQAEAQRLISESADESAEEATGIERDAETEAVSARGQADERRDAAAEHILSTLKG